MKTRGSYKEIADRMKKIGDLRNDSAIAKDLGITPQALSNYKKRDSMPTSLVVKFAEKYDCSTDELFYGLSADMAVTVDTKIKLEDLPMDITLAELKQTVEALGHDLIINIDAPLKDGRAVIEFPHGRPDSGHGKAA